MPVIDFNGQQVSFPDDMSPEELKKNVQAVAVKMGLQTQQKTTIGGSEALSQYGAFGYGMLEKMAGVGETLGLVSPETYKQISEETKQMGQERELSRGLGGMAGTMTMAAPAAVLPGAIAPIVGASALGGGAEGASRLAELKAAGVDEDTRKQAAIARGVETAAEFAVPLSWAGKLLTRMATGAGANIAFNELDTEVQNQILQDYPELQGKHFDLNNMTVSGVMGAVLGGAFGPRVKGRVETEGKYVPSEAEERMKAMEAQEAPVEAPRQDIARTPIDEAIQAREQPAMGPVERTMPTEETGLTPARTEDVLAAQARENQARINAEEGGGIFIKDQGRIQTYRDEVGTGSVLQPRRVEVDAQVLPARDTPPVEPVKPSEVPSIVEVVVRSPDPVAKLEEIGIRTREEAVDAARAVREEARAPTVEMAATREQLEEVATKLEEVSTTLPESSPVQRELSGFVPKGQRGSWTPFASSKSAKTRVPNREQFIAEAVAKGYKKESAEKVYTEMYGAPQQMAKQKLGLSSYQKIRDPNQAIDNAAKSADLDKPKSAPVITNQGRQWAWRSQNKGLTSLVEYAETVREDVSKSIESTLRNGKDGVIELFHNLMKINRNELSEVMTWIQENQFNPESAPTFKSEQQRKFFESYKRWTDKLYNLVNDELVRQGKKALRKLPNYFPSLWYGDFNFAVRVKTEKGTKLAFLVKESSRASAEKAMEYFKREFGDQFEFGNIEYAPLMSTKSAERSLGLGAMFEDAVRLLGDEDPLTMKAKEALEQVHAKMAFDTKQYKQRFKFKAGVRGYLGDKPWKSEKQNLNDMFESIERVSNDASAWVANQRLVEFNKEVQAKDDIPPNIRRSFLDYTDSVVNTYKAIQVGTKVVDSIINTVSKMPIGKHVGDRGAIKRFISDVSAIETVRLLGWNARMTIQQELQPFQVLLPKMVELADQGGAGAKDIGSAFIIGHLQGTKLYAAAKSKHFEKFLDADEKAMLEYVKKNEVSDLVLVERDQFKDPLFEKMYRAASLTLKEFESHSRFEAFVVMSRYFRQSGMPIKEAMEAADNVSRELMGNYSEHVRAGIFKDTGFLGQLSGRLQSFKIFQLTQLAHYLAYAKKTGNIAPVATLLATQVSLGGLLGVVGMDAAETVTDMLREYFPDMPTIKEAIIKNAPDPLAYGALSTMTDSGLYGSFAVGTIGDLGWKSVFPIVGAEWDTIKSILGTARSATKRIVSGEAPSSIEAYQDLRGIMPGGSNLFLERAFLRDPITGSILSPTQGTPVYSPEDREETKPGVGSLAFNVPSLEQAKEKQKGFMALRESSAINRKTEDLKKQMVNLYLEMETKPNKLRMNAFRNKMKRYIELAGEDKLEDVFTEIDKVREQRMMGTSIERGLQSEDIKKLQRAKEWVQP